MDSIIEVQRNTHEEIERFDRALADILSRPQVTVSAMFSFKSRLAPTRLFYLKNTLPEGV